MKKLLAVSALILLAGCDGYDITVKDETPVEVSEVGRYEMVDKGTVLLDTKTGTTWRRVALYTDDSGLWDTFWEPLERKTQYEAVQSGARLKAHNESLKLKTE